MDTKKYPVVERAVKWLIIMLLAEFVLGTLLTTVINFTPGKHSAMQDTVLIAHIVLGVALIVGSLAHIFTSRSSHLLGIKPVLGFLLIIGAFASGSEATKNGNSLAVLIMALCFGAAIVTYGLSYVCVRAAAKLNEAKENESIQK